MCGICGIVQVDGPPRDLDTDGMLDRMTDAMTHRGPDDRGTHRAPGVAFGVRRLSVVDVEGGHQPFSNDDGSVWGMQNGEIYNHAVLREELQGAGHHFASRCDTEVLPHLYEQDGDDLPARLMGMFGLAVWDDRRRRALLARDRLGIKPLYYAEVGDVLVFGSELKSVLASGLIPPDLDYDAIDTYLTFGFFAAPTTPLARVRKLLPGHRLVVEDGRVRTEAYWHYPEPEVADPPLSEQEYREGLLAGLDTAVRRRLMSDVPLGAMLSGGLDSSLIVALMARHMDEPVKTFSIGFAEAGAESELDDARRISRLYGTDHHELELRFSDCPVSLEEMTWHIDEPVADISTIGFHALSRLAAEHVTVALCGQGADELLGGYRKHRAGWFLKGWDHIPRAGRRALLAAAAPRWGERRGYAALAAPDAAERLVAMSGHMPPDLRASMLRGPLSGSSGEGARRSVTSRLPAAKADALAETLHIDGQLSLADYLLHYFDRASMAHSLEVRVPFLDHELVEYCARIPTNLKVRRLRTKHVLKEAARGLVPDDIIDKRKLGFFRPAVGGWLRTQLTSSAGEVLLQDAPRCAEFLDADALRSLVAGFLAGDDVDVHLVVAILMLEVWLETYLPRALAGTGGAAVSYEAVP